MENVDFTLQNHGSIILLFPQTAAAHEWIDANLPDDVMQWGFGIVMEPRYVGDIVAGIQNDGLTV